VAITPPVTRHALKANKNVDRGQNPEEFLEPSRDVKHARPSALNNSEDMIMADDDKSE